jgi:hypothetical protein
MPAIPPGTLARIHGVHPLKLFFRRQKVEW